LETDGSLGSVGPQDGERHGLTGAAIPQFFQKNDSASKGPPVDVHDGIADAEARSLRLGHGERDGHCSIAGATTCLHGLRRGQANCVAEAPLKKRDPSALLTVRKIVKTANYTQIEVSEREEGHEREESVLEAGGLLGHKRLAAW
jgi:hypothetical protein